MNHKGRAIGKAAVAGAAVLAAACVSVLPEAGPAPRVFRLAGAAEGAALGSAAVADGVVPALVVVVSRPSAPPSLASDRIAMVQRSGDLAAVAGALWDGPAPILFQQRVVAALSAQGDAVLAVDDQQGVRVDYEMSLSLTGFEARAGEGGDATALVSGEALLIRTRDRRVVGRRTFRQTAPVSATGVEAVVAALSQAAGDAAQGLAAWAVETAPDPGAAEPSR